MSDYSHLVMTSGSATVDPATAASYGSIALWDPRNEPQLRRIADRVHTHGGLVVSQTTHMGHRGSSRKVVTRFGASRTSRSRSTVRSHHR